MTWTVITVDDLRKSKTKLEKDIDSLLVAFELMNGVTVSALKLETYSSGYVSGVLPTRYRDVKVEIIL